MAEVDIGLPKIKSSLAEHHKSYDFISPTKYKGSHEGKVVLITGGGRGLGKAMALAFAAAGANVAIVGRSADSLKATAAEIQSKYKVKVAVIPGDLTDPQVPDQLIKGCKEQLGDIDILVNNAGLARFGTIEKDDMNIWWRVFELNVRAPANLIHAVLPSMVARGKGQIFNIVSDAGTGGIPFCSAYSASKSAFIRVGQILSWEVREKGIEVYSLHPGTVATDFQYGEGVINYAELDENPQMKMMVEYGKNFLNDEPQLPADSVVALAALDEAKALNGLYINCNRDIGELLQAVKAGKLTPDVGILSLKEL